MGKSSPRMGLSFLCVLYFVRYGVVGKIVYNTMPGPSSSVVTLHVPKVISKTCLLKRERGPCRGDIRMYYFNPSINNCTTFEWGGCQGNGNRFDTRKECVETCLSRANMPVSRPRWCNLSFDYGFCFGAIKRWYYDKFWKVCKETIYSGCGGNKNNFYNFEQCDSICRLGKPMLRAHNKVDESGLKKILIINPPGATGKRGLNQTLAPTTTAVSGT